MSSKSFFVIVFVFAVFIFLGGCSESDSKVSIQNSEATSDSSDDDNTVIESIVERTGWTDPAPTSLDTSVYPLTDLQQPGSRIFYISDSSGDDTTAEIYFWNGSNIVDSSGNTTDAGVPYGTDPMNPTGPIKPFKRWSYVAPRAYPGADIGTPWTGSGANCPGEVRPQTRYEFPDWWLFKRGDTFDLMEDYRTFIVESGGPSSDPNQGSLAVPGGQSESGRQIVGAYGDSSTTARPRFINPSGGSFVSRWSEPEPKHIAYLSLHFDGHLGNGVTERGAGFSFLYQAPEAVDILFEDCWMDGTKGNSLQSAAHVTLYRCIVNDTWTEDEGHIQGLFYSGTRDGSLRVEQSVFIRNGFKGFDPKVAGWPLAGSDYNVFCRNFYISGETDNLESGIINTVSIVGASGDQFRSGLRLERNYFFQGYVNLGAHGGYPDSDGPTGTIMDNVSMRFQINGTNAHSGNGFRLTSGSYGVEVARNIITTSQYAPASAAFSLFALDWYCYSHVFRYPTRQNSIHDNIFDSSTATGAILLADGVEMDQLACSNWTYPGITDNVFNDNILINGNNTAWNVAPEESASGQSNDSVFTNNSVYSDRGAAAAALGWTGEDRNLKSYLQSLGYTITSEDGIEEYYNLAMAMRRGDWDFDLTARYIVNYIRAGFGMSSITP